MELTAPTPCGRLGYARRRLAPALAMSLLLGGLSACASTQAPTPVASIAPAAAAPAAVTPPPAPAMVASGPQMTGTASWYAPGRGLHRTCSGETFTSTGLTAASPTLPVGTKIRVAMVNSGRSVIVRVNDCMPHGHRILDLSVAAAKELGLYDLGIAKVSVTPMVVVADNN